jgi:hypothetical protein
MLLLLLGLRQRKKEMWWLFEVAASRSNPGMRSVSRWKTAWKKMEAGWIVGRLGVMMEAVVDRGESVVTTLGRRLARDHHCRVAAQREFPKSCEEEE